MKNVAVLMNTDRVGGAERSMLLQLVSQTNNNYHFLIPNVSGSADLEKMIRSYGFSKITYFKYPNALYSLSRNSLRIGFSLIAAAIKVLLDRSATEIIKSADVVYLNGQKAAFYFLLSNQIKSFDKKVVWHFRDYWQVDTFNTLIWKSLNNIKPENLLVVCNSNSTMKSLEDSPFAESEKIVVYNPSGLTVKHSEKKAVKTIGFVSMMAPWKGIHEIVLWAKMYEAELLELGIERINFYGADLYLTKGSHVGYANQLKQLMGKLEPKLVHFKGMCEPQDIFAEIDCLIHYSLEAEPFGRVLIEAFHNSVPSISTCLGGASELVEEKMTGMSAIKYDLNGLFKAISIIVKDESLRNQLIKNAMKKSIEIEKNIEFKMHQVFGEARTS